VSRRIVVTSALPYANGSIHLGHLVEYIFTDIWVRYLKLRGYDAHYFCADDTHGTPVMIRAMKEGIKPEELIERMREEHIRDFTDFGISFDNYYSTHSPENQRWANYIYSQLKQGDHLTRRDVEQFWCDNDKLFLPDRLIRGTCPRCGAGDQYGDSCEVCNSTYEANEVKEPACSICGQPPQRRTTEHIYVRLDNFTEMLSEWTGANLQRDVANYVKKWIEGGLRDWDISRDAPYFGFPMPDEEDKYFYVWLDAPIGYIASADAWCQQNGRDIDELWRDSSTEIYHIIGKDIMYFHTLFWPAMLHAAGLNLPRTVHVHGFLRVEGEKMSKSRGTFVNASTYLKHLDPQYLRYYYAAKLSNKADDIDLSAEDFVNRVNAELVNKIVNLLSRTLSFVGSRLESRLGKIAEDGEAMIAEAVAAADEIADSYEQRNLAQAVFRIGQLAEQGNIYLQTTMPWKVNQEDPERARSICTAAANLGRILAIFLKPVLPDMVAKIEAMLGIDPLTWDDLDKRVEQVTVGRFERLVDRVDRKHFDALLEASKAEFEAGTAAVQEPVEPLAEECTIDDFAKVDLRVACIRAAEEVEGARKLLKLTLDLGPLGERQVFAGIRKAYPDIAGLVGRKIICVANLKPRKMRFGVSQGMICASSAPEGVEDERIRLLAADAEAQPGDRVS
jgi:methionyl-tRNA synthetase